LFPTTSDVTTHPDETSFASVGMSQGWNASLYITQSSW